MEYSYIKELNDAYLVSDATKGAVSLLDSTELVMLVLYQANNLDYLKRFILEAGSALQEVDALVTAFTRKLDHDGWFRTQRPVNNEVLLSSVYLNLTDACNYRCVYCYQGKAPDGQPAKHFMAIEDVEHIVLKIKGINPQCRVILTGGEPFLHKDILAVCRLLEVQELAFSILTNGSLIDDNVAATLATCRRLTNVQISLDGLSEAVHNLTRGNTFHKTMKGIEAVIRHKVPFSLAPTMHDENLTEMTKIAQFAFENKGGFTPNNLRNFPHCTFHRFALTDTHFLTSIQEVETHLAAHFSKDEIYQQKLRTFINKSGNRDHLVCGAGYDLLDIDWNGTVYPCHLLRDTSFLLGHFINDDIGTILSRAEALCIRCKTYDIETCKDCPFMSLCGGGCKAGAYYSFGNFQREDPLCAILFENELNHLKAR